MAPRISLPFLLRNPKAVSTPSNSIPSLATRCFSSTPAPQDSNATRKRRHRDPYALAQARARKAANISRQETLRTQRDAALGDPVLGETTPFIRALEKGKPIFPGAYKPLPGGGLSADRLPRPPGLEGKAKNYFVSNKELQSLISEKGVTPRVALREEDIMDPLKKMREAEQHGTAVESLNRIMSLANGSSKDRLRANVQNCIDVFGRHQTDQFLPQKPKAADSKEQSDPADKRAGPDTGSSEVQIAILTAKIRTLSKFLSTRGTQDKMNKRNLRLLVHRRQKLLQYLRKKERGGPRWQHCIEMLGLTEGTWKGEISL